MSRTDDTHTIRHDSERRRLLISRTYSDRVRAEGLMDAESFDEMVARARCVSGGRGPNWILGKPGSTDQIRIRPYRHGGVLGAWLADRSWKSTRVSRELSLWISLREAGIPLPIPVFAASWKRGIFWRSVFASIERERARDGIAWLAEGPSSPQVDAMVISLAQTLRRLHDAGAIHGDLHLRNILIESDIHPVVDDGWEGSHCLLIDFDRARRVSQVSPRQRIREWLRLARSLEKTGHTEFNTRRFQALTISSYCGGDRRLRRSMMRWARFESLGISRHRFAWRLSRRAS